MINFETVKNEKMLRALIKKGLRKEVHPGTKSSIDFIFKVLEDAYASGIHYDVSDLRPTIMGFASNSSNQAETAVKLVMNMRLMSDDPSEGDKYLTDNDDDFIFYDVEVFPNLFIIGWKAKGGTPVKMINPTSSEVEELLRYKLIGFNCRRYDNHIMYAAYLGYNNEQLYELSQRIIKNDRNASFAEAYGLSYIDVYEMSTVKQKLKKFEIELGIPHKELDLPWDQPVPEELWPKVAEYCADYDVVATEAVFESRKADYVARQILARMSGLPMNDTTQRHAAKIIFGNDKNPQDKFVYTDLSTKFPGYKYEFGKSTYRGEVVGEGGKVDAIPGLYYNVALSDVESMHPWSLITLNAFGPYTERFKELVLLRVAVKNDDRKSMTTLMGGLLLDFIDDPNITLKDLSYALKIVINIVYGMTSAKFDNPFKDPRNVDNIVAKYGALFMIDLKHAVMNEGYTVTHIKTDSIKIPDHDDYILNFIEEFGAKYGYKFVKEAVYEKLCLANDAVYIAKYREKNGEPCSEWTATGAQFKHPYVFNRLTNNGPTDIKDMREIKTVKTALYLDFNEDLPDVSVYEKEEADIWKKLLSNKPLDKTTVDAMEGRLIELRSEIEKGHDYTFVGQVGAFLPIQSGYGAAVLYRESDGKYHAATGSSGHRWLEAENVIGTDLENHIDLQYYFNLYDKAKDSISRFGDFEMFISDEPVSKPKEITFEECQLYKNKYRTEGCPYCPHYLDENNPISLLCKKGYATIPF